MIQFDTREIMYGAIPKDTIGAEIGVCRGANALSLYNISQPKLMYLVDIWEYNELTYQYHSEELWYNDWENDVKELFVGKNVEIRKQKSADFLRSLYDNSLDWVYIDADHNLAGEDLNLSLLKVKSGGMIMMHDFVVHPMAWDTNTIRPVLMAIASKNVFPVALTNEKFPSILLVKQ